MGKSAVAETSTLALTASRAAWLTMLTAASRVTKSGKPIAVLGTAYVKAGIDGVSWWAADTDIWRGGRLDVEVGGSGIGLLPVARALATLKACADGPVSITFGAGDVKVSAGDFAGRIPTFPIEDFPMLPSIGEADGVLLPRTVLARVIDQVLPVATHDPGTKYFMRGALFKVTAEGLTCVATDGHQLACAKAPGVNTTIATVDAIIPRQALAEIGSMLAESGEPTVIYREVDGRHVFTAGQDVVIARAVDDRFPAWERIVPASAVTNCTANRASLVALVRRVALAADPRVPKIDLAIEDNDIVVSARSAERGDATERMAVTQTGPAAQFSLNATYLSSFLETASTEDIICGVKDDVAPIVFRTDEAVPYLYVISPMRGV